MPLAITTQEMPAGHGSPEGSVSAVAGTLYRNLDGGSGATFWAKSYGPGTTGWKAMNDPNAPVVIPSGSQLPSLAGLITGNPYVVTAERRLYLVQGTVNASVQDQFGQYPVDTPLVGKSVLVGGRTYTGDARANGNRLVSGHAFINLNSSTPHEVSYHLDTATQSGNDIVTVYLGSDGTAGSTTGYAVAINQSGAYTISNGGTQVASGNTGQAMIGAAVEVAVLMDATGKVTILRNGQVVASYTPTTTPTMGTYVGLSPSLVYSSGIVSWGAAALGTLNWLKLEAVPQGGATNQALRKQSGSDFDYAWVDDPPVNIAGVNTVRSGTGAPDNSVGQNGDWYIQESVPVVIFGPKTGGAWPTPGASLKGDQGIQGPAGTVAVGTTTTGAPGTNASVTNTGTPQAASLAFTIPRGDKGVAGDSASVAVASTTTGAPGTAAAVVNNGTPQAVSLAFTIPRGDKGDPGIPGPLPSISRTFMLMGA